MTNLKINVSERRSGKEVHAFIYVGNTTVLTQIWTVYSTREVVTVMFVKILYRVLRDTALQRLHRFPLARSRIHGNLIHVFFHLPAALGFTVLLFITSGIISNVAYRSALE